MLDKSAAYMHYKKWLVGIKIFNNNKLFSKIKFTYLPNTVKASPCKSALDIGNFIRYFFAIFVWCISTSLITKYSSINAGK